MNAETFGFFCMLIVLNGGLAFDANFRKSHTSTCMLLVLIIIVLLQAITLFMGGIV